MNEVFNRVFNILSFVFLFAGILGMGVFFFLFFMHEDTNLYFYYAIATFVLGVILFTIYRRVAHLGMNRVIYSLNSVHEQVENMNEQFKRRHKQDEEQE